MVPRATMRFHMTPRPLLHLITTILLTPPLIAANPHPVASVNSGFTFNELFARFDCSGQLCGWDDQLCCSAGSACFTDSNDQAQCSSTAAGGSWQFFTSTFVETDLQTITTTFSSFVGPASAAAATASLACNFALNETPCGDICCAGDQFCETAGQCAAAANGGSSAFFTTFTTPTPTPGAPIRGTSSTNVVVTTTTGPTTTVPFEPPVATGANITLTGAAHSGGGLSGGAIAGIVIGVLLGLFLLGLVCFYCCLKGLLDGVLALFGLGGRKRRRTEVDEYERRSHHDSRHGGRRTWYGAVKPSRVERRDEKSHVGRDLLGLGAGLAGLWAILGLKRRNRRRAEETRTEYSYSSDYYTSESSASSDDRRTRYTRDTRRSQSRR